MATCSVVTCRTRNVGINRVRMHKFPKNLEVRQQWIDFCSRGPSWIPSPWSKVCTLHFHPTDVQVSGYVKARAVPQLLSPKSSLKRCGHDLAETNKKFCQVLVVSVLCC
jgi:hypothetical protein